MRHDPQTTYARALLAAAAILAPAAPVHAATACSAALQRPAVSQVLEVIGTRPVTVPVSVNAGHHYLLEVALRGNDARVDVLDVREQLQLSADHPEPRTGTPRALVNVADAGTLLVRVQGQEHEYLRGRASLRVFDLSAQSPECIQMFTALAAGDADYSRGQHIARGLRHNAAQGSAREAFMHAAANYVNAESLLTAPGDRALRGQTALALANLEYEGLQNWNEAANWAHVAADTLESIDPYRRSLAEDIAATAWTEIAVSTPAGQRVPGFGVSPQVLLKRSRSELQRLSRFYFAHGERYDGARVLLSAGLTEYDAGLFAQCVTSFDTPARIFAELHESRRLAQAWQNRALCHWGLGQLPQALAWFRRALPLIKPETYPRSYIAITTNTALIDYALGHFDESLQLYDAALVLARRTQAPRDEAFSLYGLGMNYYALGDPERAWGYLERALAIRTAALDGRGRLATLRALASIEAGDGRAEHALELDREALALALAPTSVRGLRIQIAAHTAAAGHAEEARAQLDALLAEGDIDPLTQTAARLQRGILLRRMGHPGEALADLQRARTLLHRQGDLAGEFAAILELGRAQLQLGSPTQALAAFDEAIALAGPLRSQSANPELRARLQAPLRAAYDAKIELLWTRYAAAGAAERDALARAAFRTADASRAHTFADIAAQRYSAQVRDALRGQLQERERLYQDLAARRFALEQKLERARPQDPAARHLAEDIADLERRLDTLNALIAARSAPAPGTDPRRGEPSLPAVPAAAVLVSYWLGTDGAYAWALLPHEEIHWVRLADPATIAAAAQAYHRSLTRFVDVPVEQRIADARALYPLVLQPLASWLEAAASWVIIPDGALDYVPFAALRMPRSGGSDEFVALRHDVSLTPAAWMLKAPPANDSATAPRLLLVADPVYQADDPRLRPFGNSVAGASRGAPPTAEGPAAYQRLPFTQREATQVAALFPAGQVQELIGLEATRQQLLAQDWSRYRFIHIATHGVVDLQVPELSALVLGAYDAHGERVQSAVRVADLSLETLDAELAVFSACETAAGKETTSEGLVGIGSTVLARGARAVVASLWPVSDEMGAQLMTELYRHLLRDAMSPAAALGAATRAIVARDAMADPALWAAYQVSVVSLGPGLPANTSATPVTAMHARPAEE